MNTLSITKATILDELKELKPSFAQKYGVTRIGLFGSFVRDEARLDSDSDIDSVVELSDPDLFVLVHIKEDLENDFHRQVDVVPLSPFMNSHLKSRISKEAVYV